MKRRRKGARFKWGLFRMSDASKINYNCPRCGEDRWYIQNRNGGAAAYFDPKITDVECANCAYVDDASVGKSEEMEFEDYLDEVSYRELQVIAQALDVTPNMKTNEIIEGISLELGFGGDSDA